MRTIDEGREFQESALGTLKRILKEYPHILSMEASEGRGATINLKLDREPLVKKELQIIINTTMEQLRWALLTLKPRWCPSSLYLWWYDGKKKWWQKR